MADESDRLSPRLHPDDLRVLIGELRPLLVRAKREPALPPPDRPPANLDGRDAEVFAKAAEIAFRQYRDEFMREIGFMVDKATRDFVAGPEIDRRCKDVVREATKDFLPDTKITERFADMLDDLGLPVDTKENRRETGERLRRILRWEKSLNVVIGGAIIAGLGSAFWAVAKLIGISPPGLPGPH